MSVPCPHKDGMCADPSGDDRVVAIQDGAAFVDTASSLESRWGVSFADAKYEKADEVELRKTHNVAMELDQAEGPGGGTAVAPAPVRLVGPLAHVTMRVIVYCSPCGHYFLAAGGAKL